MNLKLIFSIAIVSCSLFSCKKNDNRKSIHVSEIKFKHEGNLNVLDSTNTVKTALQIEIADNDFEHQTGLMYRKHMDNDKAMLFVFDDNDIRNRSFYMKNTYIPLDIIFIDENFKIINIAKNTIPLDESSVFSEGPAKYVLEINAGLSDQWSLNSGDVIKYNGI